MERSLLRRIGIVAALLTSAVLGSAGAIAAPSQKAVDVLTSVRPATAMELPGRASPNSGVSGVLNAAALGAPAVSLTLADGRRLTAELQRVARDDRKATKSWVGTFTDLPGSVLVLSSSRGAISGFANYGNETLEILPGKSGRHLLFEVDNTLVPQTDEVKVAPTAGGDTTATTSDYGTGGTTLAASDAVVHDLLVVYTAAAANAYGQATLESMIQSAVQSANQAYQNSLVSISLNLVGLRQVSLTETGSMSSTWPLLQGSAEVNTLRDSLAADVVVLVSQDSGCGYSYLMNSNDTGFASMAYSIVNSGCLSNQSLAHEVGHMQGLNHDRANLISGGGVYPYSYGYVLCVTGGFRDIMSYPCGGVPRVLEFSNPSVLYNGYPTGISYEADPANSAENARTLNNTATTVAAFRGTTTSTPVATVPASPTGLAASSVAYGSVSLVWTDNATNESGYEVERSLDGVGFSKIASLAADAKSFGDVAVSASTKYFYRVRAFNSTGFSAYSNTISVTTPAAPPAPPSAPTSVSATNRADGSDLVAWTSSATNATNYEVRRETWDSRKKAWGRSTLAATVPASVLSIIDTSNNGTFRYFVRATNSGGASSEAGPAQVTVTGGTKGGKR